MFASKVEEIVENGEIPEEDVHLPGVYVQGVLKGSHYQKRIEVSLLTWVYQGASCSFLARSVFIWETTGCTVRQSVIQEFICDWFVVRMITALYDFKQVISFILLPYTPSCSKRNVGC